MKVFKIELINDAENELSEAYDWYEEQQLDLGGKFYNEINHFLTLIEKNPYRFTIKYSNDLRSAQLKIFPYLIIFWVNEENNTIYVTSIFHTRRKPKYF